VLFVIGANGMGKTTTIGKIASEEHMMDAVQYVCI
jgi:signal recognition particle GTPase